MPESSSSLKPAAKPAAFGYHHWVHPRLRALGAATVIVVAGFVLAQFGFNYAFQGRILPDVRVANVAVGGLTPTRAEQKLRAIAAANHVQLNLDGRHYTLAPAEVGVRYDLNTTIDQAMMAGRNQSWLPMQIWGLLSQSPIPFAYHIDTKVEQAKVATLIAGTGPAPQNATIAVTDGVPQLQPSKPGYRVSSDAVEAAISQQISLPGVKVVNLQPEVMSAPLTAAAAKAALGPTRQLLATPIAITYQGKQFQPNPGQIGSWIAFSQTATAKGPRLSPIVNLAAVKQYVQSLAAAVDVAPVSRQVMVINGQSTQTQAGQNGVQLDVDGLAATIATALGDRQPLQTVAPTTSVPFQTQYNHSIAQPYPKYIEINLTDQHLWAYQDHQVVYDSPITSGATGAGFPTVTGTFAVYAKQTNRHLVGYQYGPLYNYDVFVQYWMPFYEGFGLHDASWRHGQFGGPDYYYDGSHGCVNLPLATAAWLYNWVNIGTPVWVHN